MSKTVNVIGGATVLGSSALLAAGGAQEAGSQIDALQKSINDAQGDVTKFQEQFTQAQVNASVLHEANAPAWQVINNDAAFKSAAEKVAADYAGIQIPAPNPGETPDEYAKRVSDIIGPNNPDIQGLKDAYAHDLQARQALDPAVHDYLQSNLNAANSQVAADRLAEKLGEPLPAGHTLLGDIKAQQDAQTALNQFNDGNPVHHQALVNQYLEHIQKIETDAHGLVTTAQTNLDHAVNHLKDLTNIAHDAGVVVQSFGQGVVDQVHNVSSQVAAWAGELGKNIQETTGMDPHTQAVVGLGVLGVGGAGLLASNIKNAVDRHNNAVDKEAAGQVAQNTKNSR